jgi:2-polyprenyl-6-methoxyphenol hydroxylase-like FAD-dependent oxidoreductase
MDRDALIVGGGPVGLATAVALGLRGRTCLVVERGEQPSPIPRGQNLTQRTMEHFHFWGIERELRAARTIPPEYGIGGMTAYGMLLGEHRYDWMRRELVRPFYFTDNERLPQYATEAVLRRRAAELPGVEALYGWRALSVRQDNAGVEAEIARVDGSERRLVRAAHAIGADGSRSLVREAAGITQTLADHDRLMVLLVFRSPELHRLLERFPGKSFYCILHPELEGYWRFLGRVDLGSTFFFHAPVPAGTTRDTVDAAALLQRAIGAAFPVELLHVGFWDLRFAIADSYSAGRIHIAGDAAHSHPPYGGYGINTGFEDAANLAWKLAATLDGWGGPALLDSYGAERRPVFASTARDFIEASIRNDRDFLARFDPARDPGAFLAEWNRRASGASGEVRSFAPHYEGSPVVCGPAGSASGAVATHEHRARAGHHLSPARLHSGADIYDTLGRGFTLLAIGAEPEAVEAFEHAARQRRVPLDVLRDDGGGDTARYGASLVLVRPDQYVAFAGDRISAAEAVAVIDRATGWMPAGPPA